MRLWFLLFLFSLLFSRCLTLVNQDVDLDVLKQHADKGIFSRSDFLILEDFIKASIEQDRLYPNRSYRALRRLDNSRVKICINCQNCCPPPPCEPTNACPTSDFIIGSMQNISIDDIEILRNSGKFLGKAQVNKYNNSESLYSIVFNNQLPNEDFILRFLTSAGQFEVYIYNN